MQPIETLAQGESNRWSIHGSQKHKKTRNPVLPKESAYNVRHQVIIKCWERRVAGCLVIRKCVGGKNKKMKIYAFENLCRNGINCCYS